MHKFFGCSLGLALAVLPITGSADTISITKQQRAAIGVTLYSNGMALIDDVRDVKLSSGNNVLQFSSISPKILKETAEITTEAAFQLIEQELLPANLTQAELLKANVGKSIQVVHTHPTTAEQVVRDAYIVSVRPQLILRIDGRIETSVPGRLVFPSIPKDLRSAPILRVVAQTAAVTKSPLRLRYLTQGFSWRADHIASFDASSGRLKLATQATLTNQSGLDLAESRMQLVTGQVNRVTRQRSAPARGARMLKAEAMVMADAVAAPSRQSLGGFHLYSLQRPVDLPDGATKQVPLLPVQMLPAKRALISEAQPNVYGRSRGEQPSHPRIEIEFKNDKVIGAKAPIPAGILRLFGTDKQGNSQFLGENHLANLAVGETAKVSTGQAFDLTVRRKQLDFKRQQTNRKVFEVAYEIQVLNGSDKVETVDVVEHLNGDWELLDERSPFKRDGNRAVWSATVPAGGEVKATYRVRIRQ